jgi:hypothetical protein
MIESGYSKLFSSLVTSTIWREDDKTRIVWITLLAIKNRHGQVAGSVPGLAAMANVSTEDCRAALTKLSSPDPDSRTKEYDGRRIMEIEGGWQVINHAKYRNAMSEDERRAYKREWQKNYRKEISEQKRTVDKSVDTCMSTLTHADADADTDTDTFNTPLPPKGGLGGGVFQNSEPAPTPPTNGNGWHPSDLQLWCNSLFRRRPDTHWTAKELKALKAIGDIPPSDRSTILRYYSASIPHEKDYRRRDLSTFLNNFPGELDRARNFKPDSIKPF